MNRERFDLIIVFASRLRKEYNIKTIALGKYDNKRLVNSISPTIISLINQTTLKQAISLISRCQFFIGPDSNLLHIASCLNVETIGLYGPTPKDYVYPYFHRENIIQAKLNINDECWGVDKLRCPPSLYQTPCLSMKKIRVDEVISKVAKKLIKTRHSKSMHA
ncbi:MAG: glycosyltransferase family 9 protein [Candidatus Gygaella obscura]|nr:glycosyltransferase family 9 protein [Candidatus Gygaella obscura]